MKYTTPYQKKFYISSFSLVLSLNFCSWLWAADTNLEGTATSQQQIVQLQEQVKNFDLQIQELKQSKDSMILPANNPLMGNDRLDDLEHKVENLSVFSKRKLNNTFNPSLGFVGETVFSQFSKDPARTGRDERGGWDINFRSLELSAEASVDPFSKAYVVANASSDPVSGEATWGIEEAALITTSLPVTIQVGRFFGDFGRLSYVHGHELPFVNRPMVLENYIGGESRTDGIQANFLFPTTQYISWSIGIGNGMGEALPTYGSRRNLDNLTFWQHLSTYIPMTTDTTLEMGVSTLLTPKEEDREGVLVQGDGSTRTEVGRQVIGLDFTLRYEPLRNNSFSGFVWGTEFLYSHSKFLVDPDGSLDPSLASPSQTGDETKKREGSYGLYSYLSAKINRDWSAGFMLESLQNAVDHHDKSQAYSPFITWNTSHFQMLRMQYTHTDRTVLESDDALQLQWTWILGAHSHGFKQR